MIHELSVSHVYTLNQGVKQKPERRTVTTVLTLSQTIRHNIRTRKLGSTLPLSQTVGLRTSVLQRTVSHSLFFSQVVAKDPIVLSVVSGYFPWQTIKQPKWEIVKQTWNPVQSIIGDGCKGVPTVLNLTQTVIGNVVRARTVLQNLGLENGVSGYISNRDFNYLNPVFTIVPKVKFTYLDTEVELRKPDFDDTYKYDFTRINRRSRGGDLLISRAGFWPATKSFTIRFTYLSQAEIDVLLNFMKLTLGKRLQYLNYDNVTWDGFITNPQTEAQQLGRSNFAISIEFEGEPL